MPRGSKPGERRGGRQRATPNRRTVLADRIVAAASEHPAASRRQLLAILVKDIGVAADIRMAIARKFLPARASRSTEAREGGSRRRRDTGVEAASQRAAVSLPALDVLFGVAQDATASLAHRRKAAL